MTQEELGSAYHLIFGSPSNIGNIQGSELLRSEDGRRVAKTLWLYILSVSLSGLPMAIMPRPENWSVQRFQSVSEKRVLLFASKMATLDAVKAAVPDLLLVKVIVYY
jgi:hypothetical protein